MFSPSYHHKPFIFYLYSSQKNIGICTYSNLLHIRRTRTKGVWCQTCFLIMTSPVCKKEDFHWVTTWILVCYSHKAISWNFQGQHFQGHCSFKKYNMCSANQNKASIFSPACNIKMCHSLWHAVWNRHYFHQCNLRRINAQWSCISIQMRHWSLQKMKYYSLSAINDTSTFNILCIFCMSFVNMSTWRLKHIIFELYCAVWYVLLFWIDYIKICF